MATDAEVAELKKWLEQLFGQVRQLRIDQYIFHEVQRVIAANPAIQKPSHFYAWMTDNYVAGMAMAIRRQVDDGSTTMSFVRFLKRLKGDPSAVSRKRYRALYTDDSSVVKQLKPLGVLEETINKTYDKLVGAGLQQPTADQIQAEIDELHAKTASFAVFANKVIAHDDTVKPTTLPTFGEVDTIVTYLEGLVQRYIQLFEAAHQSMDLNFQYDWKGIFRVPWIPG